MGQKMEIRPLRQPVVLCPEQERAQAGQLRLRPQVAHGAFWEPGYWDALVEEGGCGLAQIHPAFGRGGNPKSRRLGGSSLHAEGLHHNHGTVPKRQPGRGGRAGGSGEEWAAGKARPSGAGQLGAKRGLRSPEQLTRRRVPLLTYTILRAKKGTSREC